MKRYRSILTEDQYKPNDKIKTVYCSLYPDDEVGQTIDPKITFEQCFMGMRQRKNFYKLIGGDVDSLVRERCFQIMSKIYNVDYDIIYHLWLGKCLTC